jgi:hypothetical protein
MSELFNLPNYGILRTKLPDELFLKLVEESKKFDIDSNEFKTGLSAGLGVAKHMKIKDNYDELSEFALKTAYEYNTSYNYMASIKILSRNGKFKTQDQWFNYQNKHEYLPNHSHGGVLSYTGWIKIPYDLAKERENNVKDRATAATFQITYLSTSGVQMLEQLPIDKSWERHMIVFPSNLQHCVYPFYTSDETRISFAGNISLDFLE